MALSREVGERQAISAALYTLATLARAECDHERARDLLEEGLNRQCNIGAPVPKEPTVAMRGDALAGIIAVLGKAPSEEAAAHDHLPDEDLASY